MSSNKLRVCHVSNLTTMGGIETMLMDFLVNNNHDKILHHIVSTSLFYWTFFAFRGTMPMNFFGFVCVTNVGVRLRWAS